MGINEKLAELRKAKGLTQKELAETLHVTRQAISRWEVGTAAPSLDNLTYLSQLYGVPLDDLVNTGDTVSEPEEDALSCVSEDLTPLQSPFRRALSGPMARSFLSFWPAWSWG